MGAIAQLFGVRSRAVKAAGIPNISEDGSFSVTPWLPGLLWGLPTRAGASVTPESALALPTLYACVRVLAESTASLPLITYRRRPDGGKERATDHPMYPVFHDQPNPEMTKFAWLETLMTHEGTWGNSYNEVLEDSVGRKTIWPVPPSRIEVGWEGGRKVFDFLADSGGKKRLRADTIFHVPGLSMNGLVGLSPIQAHREALGEMMATRDFGSAFYRNSARPAAVLEHPNTLSPGAIERLATQMDELRGSGNAGKTLVMEEGLKLHEVGVPPEDAQYIETRKLQREDICALYRMQPHMVGILEHGTYANVEQESLNFVVHTLRPWLVRIEQAINAFFFAAEPDIFVEFLVDGLLRGDAVTRATALDIQRKAGVLRKNEWRAIENRNPDAEDDIWVPIANHVSQVIDADGSPVEEPEVVAEPEPVVVGPPQLSVVKSALQPVQCKNTYRGAICGKNIGRAIAYSGYCPRCKGPVQQGEAESAVKSPGQRFEYDDKDRLIAQYDVTA